MPEAMKEATHALFQKGPAMRTRDAVHPPPIRDLTNAFDTNARAFRTDAKGGTVSNTNHIRVGDGATRPGDQKRALQMQKQRNPWYTHQPSPTITKNAKLCKYKSCPGMKRDQNQRRRGFVTTLKCVECSVIENKEMFFCMTTEGKEIRNCHYKYHSHHYSNRNKYEK